MKTESEPKWEECGPAYLNYLSMRVAAGTLTEKRARHLVALSLGIKASRVEFRHCSDGSIRGFGVTGTEQIQGPSLANKTNE